MNLYELVISMNAFKKYLRFAVFSLAQTIKSTFSLVCVDVNTTFLLSGKMGS